MAFSASSKETLESPMKCPPDWYSNWTVEISYKTYSSLPSTPTRVTLETKYYFYKGYQSESVLSGTVYLIPFPPPNSNSLPTAV